MISWQVDLMRVDLVAIDLVKIDLVAPSPLIELLSKIGQIFKNSSREKLFEHIQRKPSTEFWLV